MLVVESLVCDFDIFGGISSFFTSLGALTFAPLDAFGLLDGSGGCSDSELTLSYSE
jgi:hypothetical protein